MSAYPFPNIAQPESKKKYYPLLTLPDKTIPNQSGIYGIYCQESDKWYVGQALKLRKRSKDHRKDLTKGAHANTHLQRAFDLYGADAFVFTVLTTCSQPDLNHWEKHFMDSLDSTDTGKGYNIQYFDENGKPLYSAHHADAVRNSRSKSFRFTLNDAKVMREMYSLGYTPSVIREKYRLNATHLAGILGNRVWPDPTYTKPKNVPSLNPEQIKVVTGLLEGGKSISEVLRITGINFKRINEYFERPKGRKRSFKHNCLILNQETGIYYFSLSEAARATSVLPSLLRDHLITNPERNKTALVLLEKPPIKVKRDNVIILDTAAGVYYESFTSAAKVVGVSQRTITLWLTAQKHHNKSNLILCE